MIHADDAGLSHDENLATMEALKKGIVNSYSIMVPCQGFDEIAEFARIQPEYDYGIHLTLTCEWKNKRFGPVAEPHLVQSLVDENGHFYPKREQLAGKAVLKEVEIELIAQIEKALESGLAPSHLDSHMYSVGCRADIFQLYKSLGEKFNIPVLLNKSLLQMVGLSKDLIDKADQVIDHVFLGNYDDFNNGSLADSYSSMISGLPNGLSMLIIHPAFDTEEMREITEDHPNFGAQWRQIDFDVFTKIETRDLIRQQGAELVDWRDLGQGMD